MKTITSVVTLFLANALEGITAKGTVAMNLYGSSTGRSVAFGAQYVLKGMPFTHLSEWEQPGVQQALQETTRRKLLGAYLGSLLKPNDEGLRKGDLKGVQVQVKDGDLVVLVPDNRSMELSTTLRKARTVLKQVVNAFVDVTVKHLDVVVQRNTEAFFRFSAFKQAHQTAIHAGVDDYFDRQLLDTSIEKTIDVTSRVATVPVVGEDAVGMITEPPVLQAYY